jgi:prepilin-type N-terminal cleavage/methylation domain-containing protein
MKNKRGFTLIEVVVAAAVLGMAASALFGLLSTSLFNLRKVEDLHRYEIAAQDVMNRVLLLSQMPPEGQAEGVLDEGGRWVVSIAPWAPSNLEGRPREAVLRVEVVVTWPGRSSQRSIKAEALKSATVAYSNYDLQREIEAVFPQ